MGPVSFCDVLERLRRLDTQRLDDAVEVACLLESFMPLVGPRCGYGVSVVEDRPAETQVMLPDGQRLLRLP